MARLYVWVKNDRGQEVTLRGNEKIEVQINWGSKKDSKPAVRVYVDWDKLSEFPDVSVLNYAENEKRLRETEQK